MAVVVVVGCSCWVGEWVGRRAEGQAYMRAHWNMRTVETIEWDDGLMDQASRFKRSAVCVLS